MQTIKRGLSLGVLALILVSGAVACGRTAGSTLGGSSSQSKQPAPCTVAVHFDSCWGTGAPNVNGGHYVPPSER